MPVARVLAAAILAALLAACATSPARQRAELASLGAALHGRYDNLAQVQAEQHDGAARPHEALALAIVRVQALLVGDDVYFVREAAADDPRRVFSERIWVLAADRDGGIIQTVYRFAEPERWRSGAASPELFHALLQRDLTARPGCEGRWRRTATGFRGANLPSTCGLASETGGLLRVEQTLRLEGDELDYSEQTLDAAGRTMSGWAAEAPYRFRRLPSGGD
jgi:hypothetical protein